MATYQIPIISSASISTITPKFDIVLKLNRRTRKYTLRLVNLPTVINLGHYAYAILESIATITVALTHQIDFPDNHNESSSKC